ncbi:methyltransferase, FxLD system [Streptomyces iconiensis]|uniref:Protein-L-isoaspartate O-methyltransferase n=1 Tax=Streptomyces iconiensis TaxID=1384038 RepID=A0ABT7A4M2_9ACTN|nr:methyltransferase, FxLD system [Streptomyces iconiensis]MDJ1136274.1 methyltransferase, FxLD system [Streptomyces iconiensis]
MAPEEWPQRVLTFAAWERAEPIVIEHLLPLLVAEGDRLGPWAFLRKFPTWRLRYRPMDPAAAARLHGALEDLVAGGPLTACVPGIYEPEVTAFGGPAAMAEAHLHHHEDSRQVLGHVVRQRTDSPDALGRRELAVVTISTALRAAGLDWYEQGDVWAKIADERDGGTRPSARTRAAIHRLMTVDASSSSTLVRDGRLASVSPWIAAFDQLGRRLADLDRNGQLERGLRSVLAHHALFHFNRLGLPRADQHTLSTLAKEVVMGTSDNDESTPSATALATTVSSVTSDTIEARDADRLRAQLVDQLTADGCIRTSRVEEAMRTVPRHVFVPKATLEKAYGNAPVNIKHDETGASISCASQPDIVATMLEQLDVEPGHKVLELGAGTGFNAGLLGHLVGEKGHVTTVDVDDDLVEGARTGLEAAGIDNVEVILGDGALGYAPNAPYDRIEATVGAHGVPHAWLDQLAPGGRLLTPLRLRGSVSRSILFEQDDHGRWRSIGSEMNTFMPLRAGIADDPRRFVNLADDGSVTLVTNGDQAVDADALTGVLSRTRSEAWTGVNFRGPESAEWLELWLTCTMPGGLSRMPAQKEAIERGVVTAPYASSTAAFDGGTLTYLTRRKATKKAPDDATLYEFGVIGHGPEALELADRVAEQIRIWDREYRGREVQFEIQDLGTAQPAPRPGRFAFDNPLNRMIIEWQ